MERLTQLLHARDRRKLSGIAARAERWEPTAKALSDVELRSRYLRVARPRKQDLPEALALVREAARRTLGLRAYRVQLMGAAALFDGVIAEMKTGEGKTLVIAIAAALAALDGQGVHIAVPNPYLAARDSTAMAPLYTFLGLRVGASLPRQTLSEKQAAYQADVTYAVHSELGFDYLRDHLVAKPEERVQRGLHFAIVDEADSILIDEARTPLIISHPSPDDPLLVKVSRAVAAPLTLGEDVQVDERDRIATLTERGMDRVAASFLAAGLIPSERALYERSHLHLMRYLDAALQARFLHYRDRDYLVRDGQLHIIDAATGRVLAGRRWQDGIHQALEAKEDLAVQPETETAAEITYQSYFGRYRSLAGLTGTALAAREEFEVIYHRRVIAIPTNRPGLRKDNPDLLFRDRASKFRAIIDDVVKQQDAGRPVLIGTGSVEESEAIAAWLRWASVPHRVLNARQNAEEASIIADAGLPGAVTVTTNMAGRGTDIVLGGHTERNEQHAQRRAAVLRAGGLYVIGTQRHESRRIDDQLRGRAGRQGDPGESRFYLSLEDDLLRIFGAERFDALADLVGTSEGGGRHSPLISRAVHHAQKKVESHYFNSRQELSQTDGPLAKQREVVYALRDEILEGRADLSYVQQLIGDNVRRIVSEHVSSSSLPEDWDLAGLNAALRVAVGQDAPGLSFDETAETTSEAFAQQVVDATLATYVSQRGSRERLLTEKERLALLGSLDRAWRAHLTALDAVRQGIHLRSMAQETPVVAFAREAHRAFEVFQSDYAELSVATLLRAAGMVDTRSEVLAPEHRGRISRLARCPCGSGLRFKHCHGKLTLEQTIREAA